MAPTPTALDSKAHCSRHRSVPWVAWDTQRSYPNGVKQPSLPAKRAVPVPARDGYISCQLLALRAVPVPAVTIIALLAKHAVPVPARRLSLHGEVVSRQLLALSDMHVPAGDSHVYRSLRRMAPTPTALDSKAQGSRHRRVPWVAWTPNAVTPTGLNNRRCQQNMQRLSQRVMRTSTASR